MACAWTGDRPRRRCNNARRLYFNLRRLFLNYYPAIKNPCVRPVAGLPASLAPSFMHIQIILRRERGWKGGEGRSRSSRGSPRGWGDSFNFPPHLPWKIRGRAVGRGELAKSKITVGPCRSAPLSLSLFPSFDRSPLCSRMPLLSFNNYTFRFVKPLRYSAR